MRTKLYNKLVQCLLLFSPLVAFATSPPPTPSTTANYNALLQFLKGDGAFEKWFMQVFTKLDVMINAEANNVATFGSAIGGLGALIYLGYLGWQMQEGSRNWEVTPLIKPMIFGMILANWSGFTTAIAAPFEAISSPSMAIFNQLESEVNNYRVKRFAKQTQLVDALVKKWADQQAEDEAIAAQQSTGMVDDITNGIENGMAEVLLPVKEWMMRMEFKFQKLIAEVMEDIALVILRVCTYVIFFIQKVWLYVLIVLGPIAFGISLIPGFESAYASWVSKFINISLYTFIAYTIINIGQQLIMAGYQLELERLAMLVDDAGNIKDEALVVAYIGNSGMIHTIIFPIVGYLTTGVGLLLVPSIADSIVSAGSAQTMSKTKAAAGAVGGSASRIGGRAVGGMGKFGGRVASATKSTVQRSGASAPIQRVLRNSEK